MMNLNDVGDPLTFLLAPPAGKSYSYHVNYLNNYWMDWHIICDLHSRSPDDESCYENWYNYPRYPKDDSSLLWRSSEFSSSATSSSKFYLFCAIFQHLLDIYGPWMMNPDYSDDPDSFSTENQQVYICSVD